MGASSAPKCIFIAASGTGGHLLPAVQVAKALRELAPEVSVEFIGSGRPLEEKLIDGAGFTRHIIPTFGVKGRGIRGIFEFLLALPRAFLSVWSLISSKRPAAVVGVGGYVSVLPVLAAAMRSVPTWIHEAELRPGLANSILCWVASRVSVAFEAAKLPRMGRVVYTGHPVRRELRDVRGQRRPSQPRHLLVMGGSQGAASLDAAIPELGTVLVKHKIEILHQCRPENVERVARAYKERGVEARVVSFLEDMPQVYTWANVVICRSGAGTVMEIEAVNLPALFVPYPYAQGNHQAANAKTLASKGKALVVEEGEGFLARLSAALELLLEPEFHARMLAIRANTRSLDAAENIAKGVLQLAK